MIIPMKANSLYEPVERIWRVIEDGEEYSYWPCCPLCDTIIDADVDCCPHCGVKFKEETND